ncbi:MAG TPA: nucleotidyltransferase [Tissierellia bacterium]|nr:nucleotidyltransferase [Tissierellia bacterium]
MKVVGIVAEYNPFHFGHKYHLEMSKKITDSEYAIAVMSGSFVQRGEPSLVDKWTKAKMAIDNGVDLVIELPFIFATQSAELFAYGSVALLNSLNIVDYISFGSEEGKLDILSEIAHVLIEEPPYYRESLKTYLKKGDSFSVSRQKALKDYCEKYKVKDINLDAVLNSPNNILAIEYLKALIRLNSSITPVTIKRIGSHFKETNLSNKISSATAIRKKLLEDAESIDEIKDYVPHNTYVHLFKYLNSNNGFNSLHNYNQIIHYLLRINCSKDLKDIIDIEPGLENRIIDMSSKERDLDSFIQSIVTKRYPRSRIQRILIHLMAGLKKSDLVDILPNYPSYIRVLGANEKGFKLLRKIKEKSDIPIITKFADYKNFDSYYLEKTISYDKKATDLFYLGINSTPPFKDRDFYTTCYIKK